jgi:hypothetical protein
MIYVLWKFPLNYEVIRLEGRERKYKSNVTAPGFIPYLRSQTCPEARHKLLDGFFIKACCIFLGFYQKPDLKDLNCDQVP